MSQKGKLKRYGRTRLVDNKVPATTRSYKKNTLLTRECLPFFVRQVKVMRICSMKTSLTFNGLLLSVWMVARRLLEHYQHPENNSLRNRIDIKEILKSASDT